MRNLRVLFEDTANVAVKELKDENFQEMFNSIIEIRQKLFNGESLVDTIRNMMDLGLIPKTSGISYDTFDVSLIYNLLSKAEVRLSQVKSYVQEEARVSQMSNLERVMESAAYGGRRKQVVPEWEI